MLESLHAEADAHRLKELALRHGSVNTKLFVHQGDLRYLLEVHISCEVETPHFIEDSGPVFDYLVILDSSERV